MEWARAAIVSIRHTFHDLGLWATLRKLSRLAWFLATEPFRKGGLVDEETRCARLGLCEMCVLYNPKLKTCGTWRVTVDKHGQMGCLCYLPLKARYQNSKCWLEEVGLSSAWGPITIFVTK